MTTVTEKTTKKSPARSKKTGPRSAKSGKTESAKDSKKSKVEKSGKDPKSSKDTKKGLTFDETSVTKATTSKKGTSSPSQYTTMPSVMARKQSVLIRMKIVENEESEKRLIKTCMIVGVVLVILIAAGITAGVILFLSKKPEEKPVDERIPNPIRDPNASIPIMTDVCRIIHKDECLYYTEKYVKSCEKETCLSLSLVPKHGHGKVVFTSPSSASSKVVEPVPDGVPCESSTSLTHWCDSGKCQPRDDNRLTAFATLPAMNGNWTSFTSTPLCIDKSVDFPNTITWDNYLKRTSCSVINHATGKCINNPYVFRSCTNPPPSLGGKPCWSDRTGTLSWYYWPMKLGDSCSDCTENQAPSCPAENVECIGALFGVEGEVSNDFFRCCDDKEKDGILYNKTGRCMIGTCLLYDPTFVY